MALFSEDPAPTESKPIPKRRLAGWWLFAIAAAVALVFVVTPSPYVIEQPGPTFDTLGTAPHVDDDGEESEVPLISIEGADTYPTEGELRLLTVSVVGRPGNTPNWLDLLGAWVDPERTIVPLESVYPSDVDPDEQDAANQAAMVDSQQDAIAAALVALDLDVVRDVTVAGVLDDSPATGLLQEGDVIRSVDGTEVHDISALRAAVAAHGTDAPADLGIVRDGTEQTVQVTPVEQDGVVVLGVGVTMHYEFPIDVELRLDDVGGPSAGQMFALGIIDELTPGAMTGGENWAGTGTIDSSGNVGPIGGIRQKMFGALNAGAEWFLAPESNCDEVVGHVPDGLRVFSVDTLDDAQAAIEAVADGGDLDALPTCTAG
ncbi:PDZ domain-containing protein [Agromyces seonyuensis]|uniref:PDZ domain-containing protein n=1 Tax=Agromyces seonyuensis TaxID=2662446 RepID=A0A6I4P1S7_9MICO|nr:PDZ domain-containing protein [Agromyces seonyuensis]MWC00352.1 PDZ domain-containing protein [Agromyces seonyuensis]